MHYSCKYIRYTISKLRVIRGRQVHDVCRRTHIEADKGRENHRIRLEYV